MRRRVELTPRSAPPKRIPSATVRAFTPPIASAVDVSDIAVPVVEFSIPGVEVTWAAGQTGEPGTGSRVTVRLFGRDRHTRGFEILRLTMATQRVLSGRGLEWVTPWHATVTWTPSNDVSIRMRDGWVTRSRSIGAAPWGIVSGSIALATPILGRSSFPLTVPSHTVPEGCSVTVELGASLMTLTVS